MLFYDDNRVLSSAFNRKRKKGISCPSIKPAKKPYFEYERDIILLPMNFGCADNDSVIPIPRSKANRLYLSENGLIGKILLKSVMT